ncbi:mirror-image polydactyly gene 1 protein isoform X3 [Gouania willdenowi]|nr:mirror-image polydactyly gene 1 protein isoform X3 [Gouania willdenowi]
MASSSSRSTEMFITVERLKRRIREQQEEALTCERSSPTPNKEFRDSLVNMYRDNPGVNEELRLRLPPPIREQLSPDRSDISDWPQAPVSPEDSPSVLFEDMKENKELKESQAVGHVDSEASPKVLKHFPTLDRHKNISFLLKELDVLRHTNNKLHHQILRMEEDEVLQEEQKKKKNWEEPTALMMELMSNQKSRDQAMMSRLLLANEERDEALLRVDQLQRLVQMESVHPDSPDQDQDVDQLLQRVCSSESAVEVHQVGSIILQCLRSARQRRDDIIVQEMKAVMEERDKSVGTYQQLLQQVDQRPTEEQLLALQRERDVASDELRRVEAELQSLQTNQISQTPPNQHEAPALLLQLNQLSLDKQRVEAELRRSQEEEQQANERVQRLERLVEVLRKKVGGGAMRPVL